MALKLLAGPIVRRAAPDAVWVWLATSEALTRPRLILYGLDPSVGERPWTRRSDSLNAWSGAGYLRATNAFHVYLIAAAQTALPGVTATYERAAARQRHRQLPTAVAIAYDIRWGEEDEEKGLADLDALAGIVYPPFDRPTFILQPPRRAQLRALYGSCRKFHGYGTDAIVTGDRVLRQHAADPRARPQVLLLGGDQIYADDVPDTLIRPIQGLAKQLLGRAEPLPGIREPHRIGIRARQDVTTAQAGFSSGEAGNHLMTFGEFAAAYLLAWNPDIWPRTLPAWQTIWREIRPRIPEQEARATLTDERRRVEDFRTATAMARRLLANVPTYMMFDDHEVTDDWSLNAVWDRRVGRRALGRRILANGLAAFWLFQGWGNEPLRLARNEFYRALAGYLSDPANGGAALDREFLGFHAWAFRTPTRPSAVFANTRTQRGQTTSQQRRFSPLLAGLPAINPMLGYRVDSAPRLMNNAERRRLRALLIAARQDDPRLLLVAPTPLYGLDSLEFLQEIGPMLLDRIHAAAQLLDAMLPETETVQRILRTLALELSRPIRNAADRQRLLRIADLLIDQLDRLIGLDDFQRVLRKAIQAYAQGTDAESFHVDPNSYLDILHAVATAGGNQLTVLSGDVHYGFTGRAHVLYHGRALDIVQLTSSAAKNEAHGGLARGLFALQLEFLNDGGSQFWWRNGDRTTAMPGEHEDSAVQAKLERAFADEVARQGGPHVIETFSYVPRTRVAGFPGLNQLAETRNNMGWLNLDSRAGRNVLLAMAGSGRPMETSIPYSWQSQ